MFDCGSFVMIFLIDYCALELVLFFPLTISLFHNTSVSKYKQLTVDDSFQNSLSIDNTQLNREHGSNVKTARKNNKPFFLFSSDLIRFQFFGLNYRHNIHSRINDLSICSSSDNKCN
jgi:hypothetical protein